MQISGDFKSHYCKELHFFVNYISLYGVVLPECSGRDVNESVACRAQLFLLYQLKILFFFFWRPAKLFPKLTFDRSQHCKFISQSGSLPSPTSQICSQKLNNLITAKMLQSCQREFQKLHWRVGHISHGNVPKSTRDLARNDMARTSKWLMRRTLNNGRVRTDEMCPTAFDRWDC